VLLIILYAAFIGLGLPSGLLGAAWPSMQVELDAPVYMAGVVAMVISGGTILSTLMADKMTKKIRPGLVVAGGVFFIGISLVGFGMAGSIWLMCLWAIPMGLGSGAVDAVINNYIANNYSSRLMNWLHCFWGFGAMLGPYVMGFFLVRGMGWNAGYLASAVALGVILIAVVASLKQWKSTVQDVSLKSDNINSDKSFVQYARVKGVKYGMLAFFAYCSMEGTAMLWAATFLVEVRGVTVEAAATFSAMFYIGITLGRVTAGFVSNRLGVKRIINVGLGIIVVGVAAIGLPFMPLWGVLTGLVILGLGCAPIFPALMHATPAHFGAENSQALVGMQMASAYTGLTFVPPLFGLLVGALGVGIFPVFLFVFFLMTGAAVVALHKSVA